MIDYRTIFLAIALVAFQGVLSCSERSVRNDITFEVTYYGDTTVKDIVQKRNGVVFGKAFRFDLNGRKVWEWNYVGGKKEGDQLAFQDGKLISKETYADGVQHGWAEYFSPECVNLVREGQIEAGKMNGLWYEYYGGALLEIGLFQNDSLVKVVYRDRRYLDRDIQLPPISDECCCVK